MFVFQVFLLDSQYVSVVASTASKLEVEVDETRSFIFIMYPPENETDSQNFNTNNNQPLQGTLRVPFRNIVVGLVSHQLLLQTLGLLLLTGSKSEATETEQNLLPMEEKIQSGTKYRNSGGTGETENALPGSYKSRIESLSEIFWSNKK